MSVCLLVTANFFGTKNAYCNHTANHNKDDTRDQDEKDVASKVKVILATLIIKIILEWYISWMDIKTIFQLDSLESMLS